MVEAAAWVDDDNSALLVDLYELTMAQAYWRERLTADAVFSLYVRDMPPQRNYLVACGLESVLRFLEGYRFTPESLHYLSSLDAFSDDFLRWLGELRFTGDVHAMPEGTPVFADEPILELVAPLPQAQLVETFVMNQIHLQTVLASKVARVVGAAAGRAVVEFGLRRIHGVDAGLKAARAAFIAGARATSNVLAGKLYRIPVTGTIAHSYIQAHDNELDAFRAFANLYPETVLLVDTYDTLGGVRKVVELARELGDRFRVRGVRLDSGDLSKLAFETRKLLDRAGLERVEIFASGGLDEHRIASLVARQVPIDGFGVGTRMGVSRDVPALDMAYKLVAFAGSGRLKLSRGKKILPGRKQVFRRFDDGVASGDTIARDGEPQPGRSLLRQVMRNGERTEAGREPLQQCRRWAQQQLAALPRRLFSLEPAEPPYPVRVSASLRRYQREVAAEFRPAAS